MSMHIGRRTAALTVALVLGGGALAGCSEPVAEAAAGSTAAKVEEIDGQPSRITLQGKAAQRLGLATQPVVAGRGAARLTVPESAILYDPDGQTFVFTNPRDSVYVRAEVTVVEIADGQASLSAGPPAGITVVTVGAAELFGVETGLGQ